MSIGKYRKLCWMFTALLLAGCSLTNRIPNAYVTETALPPGMIIPSSTSSIQDFTATPLVVSVTPNIQIPTDTPFPTETPPLAQVPACDDPNDTNLLSSPLSLKGTAGNSVEPDRPYQELRPDALFGKDVLKVVIDIHGSRIGAGAHYDESANIIEQPAGSWKVVSIVWYKNDRGEEVNGVDGKQTIYIPLTDFIGLDQQGNVDNSHLNLEAPAGPIHVRFWNANDFLVDIDSIVACNSQPGK